MADKFNQEEEYQFSDATEEVVTKTESLQEDYAMLEEDSNHVKRNIIILSIAAIFVVVAYNLLFSSSSSNNTIVNEMKPVAPIVSNTEVVVPETPQITTPAVDMDITSKAMENNSEILFETTEKLSRLGVMLESIEDTLKDLDSRIIDLQANQTKLQQKVAHASEVKNSTAMVKKAKPILPIGENYQVLAVIHGRAWIKERSGSTLTVKLGDSLPGYGRVKLIEPEQGVVVMSTGDVIKFDEQL